MSHASKRIEVLRDRAHMLGAVRSFFAKKDVLEVDCPALISNPTIDPHLEPIQAGDKRYLHTSPEFAMKRLLSEGIGDIYQLGHVFRSGDLGAQHEPEFTMIEWYRHSLSLSQLAKEACDLTFLFISPRPISTITYRDAFLTHAELDPFSDAIPSINNWDRDTTLDYLFAEKVEPHLGQDELTIITEFPPEKAELAQTKLRGGKYVSERFEIYCNAIELANGYDELHDAEKLTARFHKANELREQMHKKTFVIDPHFLAALRSGLPSSTGIAMGFDRLMMLRHNQTDIKNVLPFHYKNI